MEKGFLDKVEDNAAVRIWSEKTQQEKCDSLTEGYVSKLWDFTHINVTQNNLQELKEKGVDIFDLSIYGLVIFPKAPEHIDDAVSDLVDRLNKRVMYVQAILAETFRFLSACWRAGEGRFIGICSYAKVRRHFRGEMDGNSPKSLRRRH
ncbi:hypothetical protein Gotur_011073 [Gossypium turneri]